MALNTWWQDDSSQRYWMEVATTGSLGKLLIAPKFSGATWSYELVRLVRPGDRILHWRSEGAERGLVGWSVVKSEPEVVPEYTWQPRGTSGRALAGPRTTEGWKVPLGGLNKLAAPLLSSELQARRDQILDLRAVLNARHGSPTYFPFYLYGNRELRAQQGYLVKFPAEMLELLPELDAARSQAAGDEGQEALPEETRRPRERAPKGRPTRIQDPELRSAIENHAVDLAIEYYTARGGSEVEKLGKPYDVKLIQNGHERHLEVKGSSLAIETVELTINEVRHARTHELTDLVVVDGIDYMRTSDGIETSGGRVRVWRDWQPDENDLAPQKFAYQLPPFKNG